MNAALLALVLLAIGVAIAIAATPLVRRRRRQTLAQLEFAPHWTQWLQARVPIYARLPAELRTRLHELVQIFVREKRYVGCNGLAVTDEMRVVIAAYACILMLGRREVPREHFYDDLASVLVYPTAFIAPQSDEDDDGVVTEGEDVLTGQAWDVRRIILSWEDIEASAAGGENVALHEFAHYLDMEDETMDGAPGLGSTRAYQEWSETFWAAYDELCGRVDAGEETFLDPYAATEPAEFFAVATEAFFMESAEFERAHPPLYEQLRKYYRLNPARWGIKEEELPQKGA